MNRPTPGTRAHEHPYPPAPEGLTAYVVGDIHGRLDLLVEMHRKIDLDRDKDSSRRGVEIYLGDYIDRGPDSAGVIGCLLNRAQQAEAVFLRGNHEQLLLDFLGGSDCWQEWKAVGAATTLASYGLDPEVLLGRAPADSIRHALSRRLPPQHLEFFEATGSYVSIGPYLAVHAGLRPGISLENQRTADLLGIRRDFTEHAGDFGCIVVHGHTPVSSPDLRRNRINIDTGAYATNRLTCLKISADGAHILGA